MSPTLIKLLSEFDGVLISNPVNITYLLGFDLGFSLSERECLLLIIKKKKLIITDKRYSESVKKLLKDYEIIEFGVNYFLKKSAPEILKKTGVKKIGFEGNNLTFLEYRALKKFAAVSPITLSDLRLIKSTEEINCIKKSCRVGDKAFEYIIKEFKIDISEKEIAEKIVSFIKSQGDDISFYPIVAFGKHSSVPHHQAGKTKLKKDQIILLDFGVKFNNYCSDMTRTVFFGSATTEFKRIHKTVLTAQQKAFQYINSQLSMVNGKLLAKDIDKIARKYILEQGFPNIIHSVGHGIGIGVHESPHLSPDSKDIIKTGMVFSVEPGIYIEGYGGVRIEDLVLVTKKGIELISHANREIIEVYAR